MVKWQQSCYLKMALNTVSSHRESSSVTSLFEKKQIIIEKQIKSSKVLAIIMNFLHASCPWLKFWNPVTEVFMSKWKYTCSWNHLHITNTKRESYIVGVPLWAMKSTKLKASILEWTHGLAGWHVLLQSSGLNQQGCSCCHHMNKQKEG